MQKTYSRNLLPANADRTPSICEKALLISIFSEPVYESAGSTFGNIVPIHDNDPASLRLARSRKMRGTDHPMPATFQFQLNTTFTDKAPH